MRTATGLAAVVLYAWCAAVLPAAAGDTKNQSDLGAKLEQQLQAANSFAKAKAENDSALQSVELWRKRKKAPSAAALDGLAAKLLKVSEELATLQKATAACATDVKPGSPPPANPN